MSATELLERSSRGDEKAAEELLPLVYDELKELARRQMREESPRHTLQPTALAHEAYLRLIQPTDPGYRDRGHFLAVAARVLRNVLVDHARRRLRDKRGGDRRRVTLDTGMALEHVSQVDVLSLSEALDQLAELSERQARVVELRYFGGLTLPEIAAETSLSLRTIEEDWHLARTFLFRKLGEGAGF